MITFLMYLTATRDQHNFKKHNGPPLFVSYSTRDIEDEYFSWEYNNIERNDTIETTHEKWVKRCKAPNQKRHRYMNKGKEEWRFTQLR